MVIHSVSDETGTTLLTGMNLLHSCHPPGYNLWLAGEKMWLPTPSVSTGNGRGVGRERSHLLRTGCS